MKNYPLIFFFLIHLTIFSQTPGNIDGTNIQLWVKADAGVVGASPMISWADQSGKGHSLTVPVVPTNGPTLVADLINFNPAVDLDGIDDIMQITNGLFGTTTFNNMFVYIVTKSDVLKKNFAFFEALAGASNERFGTHLPWSNGQLYYDVGLCCGSSRISVPWGENTGNFYLWTLGSSTSTATLSTTRKSIYKDGDLSASNNNNDGITGAENNFYIGGNGVGSNLLDGSIAEMIVLSAIPTESQQRRIHTYLAIKYGITLGTAGADVEDGDYLLSDDATTVWDASTNAAYHNDIVAIGEDDDSDLDQRKSRSINSGSILTIDKGGSFSSNLDMLIVGNNGETSTATTIGAHPDFTNRLERVWRAEVNGTPGTISVSFELGGLIPNTGDVMDYALLRDTDTDFSNGSAIILNRNLVGDILTFSNLTFADGDLFTLGTGAETPYPGGIEDHLSSWFRADNDVNASGTNVSSWDDFFGSGLEIGTTIGAPQINSSGINFNPSVDFDGNDELRIIDNLNIRTMFMVYNHVDGGDFDTPFTNASNLFQGASNGNVYQSGSTSAKATGGTSFVNGLGTDLLLSPVPLNTEIQTRQLTSNETVSTTYYLGSNKSASGEFFTGQVSEIIIYDDILTDLERDHVESYLAIKYGITLDNSLGGTSGDILDTDNNIIWDASDNSDYHENIVVIGQDDKNDLTQKQSKSESANSVLTVSLGTAVAPSNSSNVNTFTDNLDFLAVGSKPSAEIFGLECGEVVYKANRDWKVQKTGFDGTELITLQFDMTSIIEPGDFDLVIDTDGNFATTGDQITITTGSLSGVNLTFSGIDIDDLANNSVFTLTRKIGYDIVYDVTWAGGSGAGGLPDSTDGSKRVVIEGNVTLASSFACECLKIDSGIILTLEDTEYIDADQLILNGDLYLEGDSELIQIKSDNTNKGNGSVYKIIDDARESKYRYNYFSAPVNTSGTFSLSGNLKFNTGGALGDNTDPSFTGGRDGSGTTISTRWLYTLNSAGTYVEIDQSTALNPGVGFTMKGTDQANKYNFIGTPNNGDITALTVITDEFAIIGNPYPSAINADTFNTDMLANNITDGTVYFWDQPTGDSHYQDQYNGGYATIVGGTGAPASGVASASTPTNIIRPGQGFVVTGGTSGGPVVFTNSMRFANTSTPGGNFFKNSKKEAQQKPIIRLGFEFDSPKGTYHRQLVTSPSGGTLSHDKGKDALMFDEFLNDAYWKVNDNNKRYVITNVPIVNDDLSLDIGVVLDAEKEITFTLDATENFTNDIYLLDKQEHTFTNLKTGDYKITSTKGTNTDRFSVVFKESTTLKNNTSHGLNQAFVYVENNMLKVVSETGLVQSVKIYDLTGRKLIDYKNSFNDLNAGINIEALKNQLIILMIHTDKGFFNKKLFLR